MARMLAAFLAALTATWQPSDALAPSTVLLVAAILAVAGVAVLIARLPGLRSCAGAPARTRVLRNSGRGLLIRHRDPDGPGRPRPRAPSTGPLAAAT
jgi:hypothetical protein